MMESIAELKSICQTTAHKDKSNVYMRFVCRPLSIYVTRWMLQLKISADQVSFLMILTGVLAAVLFLSEDIVVFFCGAMTLQFWYILDCVDGEVARYRFFKETNAIARDKMQLRMTGGYWDYLNHYIVHGLVPLCVGYGLYKTTLNDRWLLWAFMAGICQIMLLAVHDTKSKAFIEKIRKLTRDGAAVSRKNGACAAKAAWSWPKRIFVWLHYSVTYPTVMNVLTILAVLNLTFHGQDLRAVFIQYYAAASALVFIALAGKNLRADGVDREFDAEFSKVG